MLFRSYIYYSAIFFLIEIVAFIHIFSGSETIYSCLAECFYTEAKYYCSPPYHYKTYIPLFYLTLFSIFSFIIFSFIRIVQQTVLGAANIDGGVYSEPIMYLKMILEWHGTKPSEQEEWASKHGIIRYWFILYCIVLYCTVLSHIISHCIAYYCIVQYSIVLYCIVLY